MQKASDMLLRQVISLGLGRPLMLPSSPFRCPQHPAGHEIHQRPFRLPRMLRQRRRQWQSRLGSLRAAAVAAARAMAVLLRHPLAAAVGTAAAAAAV